ncbi:hypothetical protein ACLOAV_010326 [Pseudogymnoascus australis]
MRFFTVAVAALSATIAVAHPTILKTVAECEAAYAICRSGDNPDRNFSTCASEHAACLAALGAASTGKFANETDHYTTQVVTAYTTYCPVPTTISHGNKTYTVTEATTLTITDCPCTITIPATPVPTGPAAGKSECETQYDFCRSGDNPDRNMSLCASQYAECKAGTSSAPGPVPTAPVPGKSECETQYDSCRSGDNPDRNMSLCASQNADCKAGTSSVSAPGPVSTAPAPGKSECEAQYDFCRSGDNPDRNMSLCASQYAECKAGASQSSGVAHPTSGMLPSITGSRPQFTGAASSRKPAYGFLALGALPFL